MRGLIDAKGEQFAYFIGNTLYTLDNEPTGRLHDKHIVDLSGNPVWLVIGDGVFSLDGSQTIGFIGGELTQDLTR